MGPTEPAAFGRPLRTGSEPSVRSALVDLSLDDPDRRLAAVRLWQEVGIRSDLLDLQWDGGTWRIRLPWPDVWRMEYRFDVTHVDGTRESILDPGNPDRVPSAFGDRSVVTLPGYRPPSWVTASSPSGSWVEYDVATPFLETPVPARVWCPAGLGASEPAPLLVVHDGPEYEALASLSRFLSASVEAATVPPLRAALLAPGHRDQWYSASADYARALSGTVLPTLRERIPTTWVVGMGTSLGALSWLHAHRLHPGIVDGLFLQSGSFLHPELDPQERWFSGFTAISAFVMAVHDGAQGTSAAYPSGAPVPVAMTCGRVEENLANNRLMAQSLALQGYPVTFREVPDAHNFTAWRDAFDPDLADLLMRVSRR